jgi:hypothetical protein
MGNAFVRATVIIGAVLAAAACSGTTATVPASSSTTAASATTGATTAPAASSSPAQAETAAAARAAAQQYFGLYSAGQFADAYGLLMPSIQQAVSEKTWVAVHEGCPVASAGLAYQVSQATLTGNTAIVSVSLSGVASSLGSKSVALTYVGGRWGINPGNLGIYQHGSVHADLAAARAAGFCASS